MWGAQYCSETGTAWDDVETCDGMTVESVRTVCATDPVVEFMWWYDEDPVDETSWINVVNK